MTPSGLRVERRGPLVELVLDRPGKRNAIDARLWGALAEAAGALAADSAVRVVVLRGEPPAFSAGADIAEFPRAFADPSAARAYNDLVQGAMAAVEAVPVPVIAAVRGDCVGGGCGLALACDLRFAAADARFAITPARLGLAYALGDLRRLIGLVGPARAKDLLFSARTLDAAQAQAIGLVDRVVAPTELDAAVGTYADRLLELSGNSQRLVKQLTRLVLAGETAESGPSRELRDGAATHADFKEGLAAFQERRPPRFA